ncbi:hypothetical protein CR513_06692, partial [Mucuna pruriens]
MVNKVGAIDNLRLENQLTKLTSLLESVVFVLPWSTPLTCAPHCNKLNQTILKSTIWKAVVSTESESRAIPSSKIWTWPEHASESKQLSAESKIPIATVPTTATTKCPTTRKLAISGGADEAVGYMQPGVSTNYELQQHAISTESESHDPGP